MGDGSTSTRRGKQSPTPRAERRGIESQNQGRTREGRTVDEEREGEREGKTVDMYLEGWKEGSRKGGGKKRGEE